MRVEVRWFHPVVVAVVVAEDGGHTLALEPRVPLPVFLCDLPALHLLTCDSAVHRAWHPVNVLWMCPGWGWGRLALRGRGTAFLILRCYRLPGGGWCKGPPLCTPPGPGCLGGPSFQRPKGPPLSGLSLERWA